MGEPRYNGAFVPLDDEAAEAAIVSNSVTGGLASIFPKKRPGVPVSSASAADEGEKIDFNEAGRHNGAFQMSLDARSEQRIEKMGGMHPITKWIASKMEDPVSTEKRLAAHLAFQEAATLKARWANEQPMLGKDVGYWKLLRPLHELHAGAPAGSNTYKMHVLNMETHEA
ncbi:hypothetical protein KFE25_007931 [Diacronema lutheri]|uniref:Uncharacterized protein n=2 Tax=Diacronema lutheri TaxID=2081491 RepID=A0A8J6C9I6_DIALT|nr:hypothetical protein KFE25_007931 [Diacronema lutheri]